jgi:hypothetical protein
MKRVGAMVVSRQTEKRITTKRSEVERCEAAMDASESTRAVSPGAAAVRLQQLLLHWWQSGKPDQQYLAAATDHADLERRQQALERMTTGPALATFNH